MKTAQIYIASAVFVLLTAIKIAFPPAYAEVSDVISQTLNTEEEQTQAAISTAESIIKSEISGKPILPQGMITGSASGKRMAKEYAENMRKRLADDGDEGNAQLKKSETVSAFAEAQAAITDADIPASVLLDVPTIGFDYVSPVEGITSSGFGYRVHPISNELKFHFGTDFAVNTGTEVKAFADGNITAAGKSESYGNYIIISHADGYETLYAHCFELCKTGGEVRKGEVIALSGETGRVTGPHLHFELTLNGQYLNPEFYL